MTQGIGYFFAIHHARLQIMKPKTVLLFPLLCIGLAGAVQAGELPTFQVTAKDGKLIPARLEVPASTRIKITIRNEGPGPIEFESMELRVEKVLSPGASSFVVLHPLKPGTYRFFDEFHPDTGECLVVAK